MASIYSPYSSGTYAVSVHATNACETSGTYTTQIDLSQGDTYSIILNAGPRSCYTCLEAICLKRKRRSF